MSDRGLTEEEREQQSFDRIIGFRAPSNDRQFPAYAVAASYRLAALAGLADQDLADQFVIGFLVTYLSDIDSEYRSPLERAMGRPLSPDDVRASDLKSLQQEQLQRNRHRETEALFE